MTEDPLVEDRLGPGSGPVAEEQPSSSDLSRRAFVKLLGAGLLITAGGGAGLAQRGPSRGQRGRSVAARLHIARDGAITVMTGKVEVGQGSRAQITQAAAEELRVPVERIRLIMADTDLVPDDGITAGSRTTPSTVPAVRRATAAARRLLVDLACERWRVERGGVRVRDGAILHPATKRTITYADLAKAGDVAKAFERAIPPGVAVTPVKEWKVLGTSVPRPNRRAIVTGAHHYPSDIRRPNMLTGRVLRPPSYGATLTSIDLAGARAVQGAVVVRDGEFVGCAAPSGLVAGQPLEALAKAASWRTAPHPSSSKLFAHLKDRARGSGGGRRRSRGRTRGSVKDGLARAKQVLRETYNVAYVQHAPMEPRAAVAEWSDGKLTVWTGSQVYF